MQIKNQNIWYAFAMVLVALLAVFFSFYKLSESPQTWTDEGLIIQTSQNIVGQGIYGFQVAPGNIISPSFISTSYPVTFPVALSFYSFGVGLLQARLVMALFILALLGSICLYIGFNKRSWVFATLGILATFPPIYGQGKNVLGEVPGLFFLVLSAYFLNKIERGEGSKINIVSFGFLAGLSLVTKPIFIVLVPGLFFVIWMLRRREQLRAGDLFLLISAIILPIFAWIHIQFLSSDSVAMVVGYYSNPHSLGLFQSIYVNLLDFITHGHTLFAGALFALWSFVFLRLVWKKEVTLSEIFLYIFSVFIFINYFRNPPYYRYFFVAEILSLTFLFRNLQFIVRNFKYRYYVIGASLSALVAFQVYGVTVTSWVASAYASRRTEVMQENISAIPSTTPVFFYQAPEAVIFLKHFNYYQYFSGTKTTEFGGENLDMLKKGEKLIVLTKADLVPKFPELFTKYHEVGSFDRYVLLSR